MKNYETVFTITKNSDHEEGRGAYLPTGISFTEKDDAEKFIKSAFALKSIGDIISIKQVQNIVFTSYNEATEFFPRFKEIQIEADAKVNLQKIENLKRKLSEEDIALIKSGILD